MKSTFLLIIFALAIAPAAYSQNFQSKAPAGFDIVRNDVEHGTIDTITYTSKTVGSQRKALVYTPPGFSKKKKYPVV